MANETKKLTGLITEFSVIAIDSKEIPLPEIVKEKEIFDEIAKLLKKDGEI